MMLVVTYDVNTESSEGAKRLRTVARLCERYGIRVQKSVFEILVDGAQLAVLKDSLRQTIDMELDSVRLYRLGNNYQNRIEQIGCAQPVQIGKELIL